MVQESWLWDHGKVPIQEFFVSIHKTRGSEWSNRAYKRVSRESLCPPNMFLSLVSFVAESLDTWSAGAKQHRPSTQQKSLQTAQLVTWQYCMESRVDRVSDHCMHWCVHRAFRRWSFEFGCQTRTLLDSNSRIDNGFFFLMVFSSCFGFGHVVLDLFPLFLLALCPASTRDSNRRR